MYYNACVDTWLLVCLASCIVVIQDNTQHYAVYISCMPSRRFAARYALGLTENPSAMRRWTIAGSENARVISEFEASESSGIKKWIQVTITKQQVYRELLQEMPAN